MTVSIPKKTLIAALLISAAVAGAPAMAAGANLRTAVFAGGCFWTMERDFELTPGVVGAVSGFTGGKERNPTYAQVSTETTGHVEAVKVTYDASKISYPALVEKYWRMIDPTDSGGQACDRGPSYRAGIFVANPEEKAAAEASKARLQGRFHGKISVPVRSFTAFWPAGDEHQDYYKRHAFQYGRYRVGCGRDNVLRKLWGAEAAA